MGIDTMVICRRILEDVPIKAQRGWVGTQRRSPITREWEEWREYDAIEQEGWLALWNEEGRVLEIRLTVPRIMEGLRPAITNYPLSPFSISGLNKIGPSIARALGVQKADRGRVLKWNEFGVRRLDVAADIPVADVRGLIRVLNQMAHAGKWRGYDTTAHWRSGTKVTNIYAKGPELLHKLGEVGVKRIEQWHGPVDQFVRIEVSLMATELKALFGLADTKWLPKLGVAVRDAVLKWVLYDEVHRRLRLPGLAKRRRSRADWACSLAVDIVAKAKDDGEVLGTTQLCTLVAVYLLLAGFKTTREVSERLGLPLSTLNKYRRQLEKRGFPPNVGYEPYAKRCVAQFLRPLLGLIGPKRPRKPTLRKATRHVYTISAPWLVEADIDRPIDGIEVIEDDELDDIAELLEGVRFG